MIDAELKKYFKNELNVQERLAFEQAMEQDEFLKDGVEGIELWLQENMDKTIDVLEAQLAKMIDQILIDKKSSLN